MFTLAQARDALKARTSARASSRRRMSTRSSARASLNCFITEDARARAQGGEGKRRPHCARRGWAAWRAAARHQGSLLHQGRAHDGGEPNPRRLHAAPMNPPSARNLWRDGAVMLGKLNLDEFAMGSSNETSAFGPVISPWRRNGANSTREDRARRFVGRLIGGGGGAICALAPRRPTPAARSASRRPSPARSASSRPMAAARAGASSPSPRRSIRPGRSRATVRDAAIMLRSMAGHDPKDTTSVDAPVPDYEASSAPRSRACASACRRNIGSTACPPEIDALWEQGVAWLKDAGAEIVEISLPHTQICAAGLLYHRAGGGLVQSRALRRRALRPARTGPRHRGHV